MSVIDTLRALAITIRNEKKKEANSAIRIGDLFLAIVDFIKGLSSGQIRQEGVDTYNDTSGGKTSLLNSYPSPQTGWTVLVRNDETNGGKASLYQWNGSKWVNLETVIYNDDVLSVTSATTKYHYINKNTNDFWLHPTGKITINGANVTLVNLAYYGQNYYSTFFNTITLEATTNFAIIIGTVDTSISGDAKPGTWTIETFGYASALNRRLNSLAINEVALMHRTDGVWFSAYNLVQKYVNQYYVDAKLIAYAPVSSVTNDFSRTYSGTIQIIGNFLKIDGLRFAHKNGNVNHLNGVTYLESKNNFDFIVANTPQDGSLMTLELVTSTSTATGALYNQKNFNDDTKTILLYKVDGVWNSNYAEIRYLLNKNYIDSDNIKYKGADGSKISVFREGIAIPNTDYTTGFYVEKGTGNLMSNTSFRYIDYDVTDRSLIWGFQLISSNIATVVGIVNFLDASGNYLTTTEDSTTGANYDGTQKIWDKEIVIPYNAKTMRLCTSIYNAIVIRKGKKYERIPNALEGLKSVTVGTSIPAGAGEWKYPNLITQRLGIIGYNEAVGSSGCRIGSRNKNVWSNYFTPTWITGSRVSNTDGSVITDANYRYIEYGFDELAKMRLNGTITSSQTVGVAVYLDTNKYFISCPVSITAGGSLTLTDEILQNAPSGTKYIRLCTTVSDTLNLSIWDAYGWIGNSYYGIGICLSMTIREKQHYIDCYTLYQTILGSGAPASIPNGMSPQWLAASYENKLINKYFATSDKKPDILFFNHAHNDNVTSESLEDFSTLPSDPFDRNTFIGSANYVINECLKYNPDLKIIFIGHYQFDGVRGEKIDAALKTLALYWNTVYIPLWNKLGWNDKQLQIKGHWTGNDSSGWTWENTSDVYTMTRKNYFIPDGVHPDRDRTGKATMLIVENLVAEIMQLS